MSMWSQLNEIQDPMLSSGPCDGVKSNWNQRELSVSILYSQFIFALILSCLPRCCCSFVCLGVVCLGRGRVAWFTFGPALVIAKSYQKEKEHRLNQKSNEMVLLCKFESWWCQEAPYPLPCAIHIIPHFQGDPEPIRTGLVSCFAFNSHVPHLKLVRAWLVAAVRWGALVCIGLDQWCASVWETPMNVSVAVWYSNNIACIRAEMCRFVIYALKVDGFNW